nr:uncharacterized protein LOC133606978 [Nerophis lumbriciformis]
MGNTQVEVQLQFNNSVSTDEIPEADVVVDTLNQKQLPVYPQLKGQQPSWYHQRMDQLTVHQRPLMDQQLQSLQFHRQLCLLKQLLRNLLFKNLMIPTCDFIFFETFGGIFIGTIVIGFRPQMGNTQVEVELQFNNSVSTDQIPEADVVVDTLVQAVNSPNNTFNLTLDSDSIAVIQPETTTRVSTTQGPTTILVPPTNGQTTAVTSVPSPVVSIEATIEEPFVQEFNDPNSEQYQSLQTQVISMCDFIFFETFGGIFIGTIVIGFRPQMGNTQVEVELQFNNSVSTDQIPEADVVVDTLNQKQLPVYPQLKGQQPSWYHQRMD